jgi:nitrous oxidase accessory protein NosD
VLDLDYGQYRLNGDLECPSNASRAAVTITGERVRFNLKGYTITRDDGSGVFLQEGILVRGANAHINNGSIVDINCPAFFNNPDCAAIRLGEAPGARINGMSLHNNTVGIISFSFGGIVGNADGARIHGNDITGNLRIGIVLSGFGGATAEGAVISDNDLSETSGWMGVQGLGYVGSTDGVSVIGNIANNNAAAGIALFGDEAEGSAQRNTIRDNTTLDNGLFGISLGAFAEAFRPHDNLIQSNTSFGNGIADLREGIPGGAPFDDCLNTWKDNDFDVATPDCIE